ncbi:HTH-type transcriptional activator IlvY [Desulforhopalus singaporensis]|uniref:HTH-type transcriptional activator IlvY n=1 Tax=Desulforhopalus singaporensis TaxID=91360 RepID=UPI000B852945|nr:HTH-type transcriptional activator IlvY [Desulforhopalus singaporensis]
MNIRDLELFKHLAATLHFGKTALECNITPSGLTRTIQRLENEIGETLFFRTNRSVNLTPAGLLFREYCEETLTRFYLFKSGLKSDTALHGELSVYCSVTAILSILPQIFKQFRSTYPKVNVRLQTGDAAKALVKLQNREVDIAIAALPDQRPKAIEFIKLIETPLLFIAPKFFPDTVVWREQQIDWEKSPLILPLTGLSRTRVEDWFGKNNIRPFIYSQVAGNEAIIAMVSMGSGIGIVPQLVLEKSSLRNKVDVLDTGPRLKPFVVGACTLAANLNNRVVQSFWDVTGEAVSTSNNSV